MSKLIRNLIPDIYELVQKRDGTFSPEAIASLSETTTRSIVAQFQDQQPKGTLRLSRMGPQCPRALWYSVNHPEMAEQLQPWATIKYTFGHIVEAMAIALAKAAGHEVTGEQDELALDGILGHRDCVIDGCVVDVKSASSISFSKFKAGTFDDTFGYLDQLDGYVLASRDDILVREKERGYLLVVDKQLGHMYLHEHTTTPERAARLRERIETYKGIVGATEPPRCECGTVDTNYYGNIMLDTRASYSAFKHVCFPSLRTFLYAKGPVFLTTVNKLPWNKNGPIREIDKNGNTVHAV